MKEPLLARASAHSSNGCLNLGHRRIRIAEKIEHAIFDGPQDYGTDFPRLFFLPQRPKVLSFFLLCVLVLLSVTIWKVQLQETTGLTTFMLLKFLSLPVVSVLFTYGHIWSALWMTFYPLEFFGIKQCQIPEQPWGLGWQGIVPSKVKKMGSIFIRTLTTQLISLEEMFENIDPQILFEELEGHFRQEIRKVLEEVGTEVAPKVWAELPDVVKEELANRVNEESPELMQKILEKVRRPDVSQYFDIEELVVAALITNKPLINHMFLSCGFRELEFIRDTGAYMGLILGVVQMVQQYFIPAGWLLPVFGVIGGLGTNWLALKMIFEPVEPTPLLGGSIVIQGQFLQRQHEVAADYARIFCENLGNARTLIPAIPVGRRRGNLCALIENEVGSTVDRCASLVQPFINLAGGAQVYKRAKKLAVEKIIDSLPDVLVRAEDYLDTAMNLEAVITQRMRAMPVKDFEQVLHPVFQEDEWILILLGGVLGYIVGMTQWYVLGS